MSDPVNQATIDLIKRNEGCILHAYPDPATNAEPYTIGYGHTGPDVHLGLVITQEQAEDLLKQDLNKFEDGVDDLLAENASTSDNQFGAMVSLAYNIGLGNFQHSSVLRYHNSGATQKAADSFLLWNKATGKVMRGLTRRRQEERQLYLTPDA